MHIKVQIFHTPMFLSLYVNLTNSPVMKVLLLYVVALLPVEGFLLYLSLKERGERHQTDIILNLH